MQKSYRQQRPFSYNSYTCHYILRFYSDNCKSKNIEKILQYSQCYFNESFEINTISKLNLKLIYFFTLIWNTYIRGFTKFGIKVSWSLQFCRVFEDLKFKISEGSGQNWCFPGSALLAVSAKLRQPTGQTQDNFSFCPSLLKF